MPKPILNISKPPLKINMPPLRSIPQAILFIRDLDPESSLTPAALRRLVRTGVIPSVCIGTKRLVNMTTIVEYLNNPDTVQSQSTQLNCIRKIPER